MEKPLAEHFEDFCRQARNLEGKSPVTVKNYRANFELLIKFKPDIQVGDLTAQTMSDLFTYLNERERKVGREMVVRDLKNSSLETIRSKLSPFFQWLVKNGQLQNNPFDGIPHPDVIYSDKRAFTKEQFDKIYLAVNRDISWENDLLKKRNETAVMFLALTGVRKGEFLGLEVKDIDLKNKTITIRAETSKSKRTRTLPINPNLETYLVDYLRARADYQTPYLWVSNKGDINFTEHGAKHLINKFTKTLGFNCHLHRFRHTFAINLYYQTKGDILSVMKALGHKNLRQTAVYLRSLGDDFMLSQVSKFTVADFL